jgi:hypothetical protein
MCSTYGFCAVDRDKLFCSMTAHAWEIWLWTGISGGVTQLRFAVNWIWWFVQALESWPAGSESKGVHGGRIEEAVGASV